ncbi:OLC1v1021228C1 [Oldenlandia corymbosa var. corymbosa]|uniref:OLC1v1021228C1 n=1 Tax=Oldenlandia corymbosa var. corymbosa TaxID=529605 RepID=A0AAV1BV71_OLDCO|nr:OLC1v1021228C1 [Oldenlandia corymbosa var. corymbosa]
MSVLGFDIGNENCVIAVAKQRGIDVLLNEESKRETPAVVSFGEKERFLGSAGAASATMNPKSTISQVKRLIGRKFREPIVQEDLKILPFESSEGPNGSILIHLSYLNEKQSFTPLQILAMLFAHLKEISEKNLENHVSDCVIGVPSYFTDLQRREYLHAAEIAGLKPLRLMHDCTATALGYGIYKTDFNGGPTNVVFVDIGHSDMQVSVASFEPGQLRILSHAYDSNLGGRDFDEVLFRYFAASFKEQYNMDVYSNARACVRLRTACEKLKKILSANPEAPLNIECLMEEKDVKGFIKREDFEKLSSDLLERISIPCRRALLESGLTPEMIHTVELVGSGSRVPAIMKVLTALFRREPSRTLNVSECVARGCALQCAMLSPTFRVREYEVQDSFPFSIGFSVDGSPICSPSNSVLFPRGHPFPSVKMLALQKSSAFDMEAFYAEEDELPPGSSAKISKFRVGPFQSSQPEKAKVKVRVQLNLHGIVTADAASLIQDHINDYTSNSTADAIMENVGVSNHESSYSDNGPVHFHSAHHKSSPTPTGEERSKAKATRRHDIPINEDVYGGLTPLELSQAQEKELLLAQQDTRMERTKDRKNSLESYVYETRNRLLSTLRSFATDTERDGISSSLQQTEEWLYDEGDDETEQVYTQKLDDLKKMVDPIEHRYKDEEARAQATKNLLNCIVEYRMAADSLPPNEKNAVLSFSAEVVYCCYLESFMLSHTIFPFAGVSRMQ